MARIFISYRRDDSAGYAGWLFTLLRNHFARDDIFMDIDSLEVGEDFVSVLEREVSSCDAVVALIGPHWLSATDAAGNRRLDDPKDFVRLELATALTRGVRVCPALVHGATMPKADALPDDLKPLVRRNAIELSGSRFPDDVRRLATALERALSESVRAGAPSEPPGRPSTPAPTAPPPTQAGREAFDVQGAVRSADNALAPARTGAVPARSRGLTQRWSGWSRLKKATALVGAAIALYVVLAIVYAASGGGRHAAAPPRPTASSSRPVAGGHPTAVSAPSATSVAVTPAQLKSTLLTVQDFPSGWTPSDPGGLEPVEVGGLVVCKDSNSAVSADGIAEGPYAIGFQPPAGSTDDTAMGGGIVVNQITNFYPGGARGYIESLESAVKRCPQYDVNLTVRTGPTIGDQTVHFRTCNCPAYDAYGVIVRVGDTLSEVVASTYVDKPDLLLLDHLAQTSVQRLRRKIR